jgi:hypothetical protein
MSEQNTSRVTRFLWMVFSPFEFIVTILMAALLYLGVAVFLYLDALCGALKRAAVLLVWRFRVGPIVNSASESMPAAKFSRAR